MQRQPQWNDWFLSFGSLPTRLLFTAEAKEVLKDDVSEATKQDKAMMPPETSQL